MSVTTHTLEAKFGQPHPFFDRWPRWLRPANDSSMMRWTHALAHKPSEFYLYVAAPLLLMMSALVLVSALPFLWLSGGFTIADMQELLVTFDDQDGGISHFIGNSATELVSGYLIMVLWSIASWMPSRRSLWMSAVVLVILLSVQAADPNDPVVLGFGMAMGWLIDELIGCRYALSKLVQVLVALLGVGVFTLLNAVLDQSLARGAWPLMMVAAMLLSNWYYFAEGARRTLLDRSQAAVRAQAARPNASASAVICTTSSATHCR